ncbi:hypothetical protein ACNFBT_22275 [Pseudomonas sp. NY15181]|uniref:hypothetical protein n=1 Tax=Pseudomonas sp. NY15181 TaxID=3400349 RepID=UPI003A84E8BC
MTRPSKVRSFLIVALIQPGLTIASPEISPCDSKNTFPTDYRTECKKEGNLKVVLAHPSRKNSTYATNTDNIPAVLIIGANETSVIRKILHSKDFAQIYIELMNLPPTERANSSIISSVAAREKIKSPHWKLIDMRTIEYHGEKEENGLILTCLTLLKTKDKDTKALLQCSDFYENDILEIKRLEATIP